jgi:hypothetical protein
MASMARKISNADGTTSVWCKACAAHKPATDFYPGAVERSFYICCACQKKNSAESRRRRRAALAVMHPTQLRKPSTLPTSTLEEMIHLLLKRHGVEIEGNCARLLVGREPVDSDGRRNTLTSAGGALASPRTSCGLVEKKGGRLAKALASCGC